jgi:hypothetical protein
MAQRGTAVGTGQIGYRVLGIYLNDHLAGVTAGTELAHRVARTHRAHGLASVSCWIRCRTWLASPGPRPAPGRRAGRAGSGLFPGADRGQQQAEAAGPARHHRDLAADIVVGPVGGTGAVTASELALMTSGTVGP